MKISEYIAHLEKLKLEHGDLEVDKYDCGFERIVAQAPQVAHRRILRGREKKDAFYFQHEDDGRKGEKVVRL